MLNCWRCHDDVRLAFILVLAVISRAEPDINEYAPQTFTTSEGHSVMFACFVSPSSGVSWTFKSSDDEHFEVENIYRNYGFAETWSSRAAIDPIIDGDFSLIIAHVSASDVGWYTCIAGDEPAATRRYLLKLTDSVDAQSTSVNAVYGQEVAFNCRLVSAPRIRWQYTHDPRMDPSLVHNGNRLYHNYNITGRFRVYRKVAAYRSVLLISETELADAGTFRCTPSNTSVSTYWEFHLSIQGDNYSQPSANTQAPIYACSVERNNSKRFEDIQTPMPACNVGNVGVSIAMPVAVACVAAFIVAAALSVGLTCAYFHIRKIQKPAANRGANGDGDANELTQMNPAAGDPAPGVP